MFALGRIRLLPKQAAAIHPTRRTPWVAAIAIAVVAIAISLVFGFAMSGPKPLGAVLFLGALVTIFFVPIYILTALSCFFYFWRKQRSEFNWIKHGVVPRPVRGSGHGGRRLSGDMAHFPDGP